MPSLQDALVATRPLLAEQLQAGLAPLFAREELLSRLAGRLLSFAREGVPAQRLPPAFSAECTPPVEESFAYFRKAVALWEEDPASPEVIRELAAALTAAGALHVLVLLGQRRTPASLTGAHAFPPPREALLASAARPHRDGDPLSAVGRALTKHVRRCPDAYWGEVSGPASHKNSLALGHLQRILDGATWWNVFGHPKHETVFEARVISGHGARWGRDGERFIGFLEPFEPKP